MSSDLDTRLKQAQTYLGRFATEPLGHFIGGKDVPGRGQLFTNHSPVDATQLGQVYSGTAQEVSNACLAASESFDDWRRASGKARRAILIRTAELIEARADEIASIECMDTGQAWRFMSKAAVRGAENFRFFADRAPDAGNGLSLPDQAHLNYTVRQPIGPVGIITPWNTPFMLSTWKIAPALAAGCTVVHKPAEWSPLSARILMEIMDEAGVPAGVVNLVNGIGETTGKALTEDPLIRAVAFIGESKTGGHVMAQGSATLKPVHLELGGKNPVIVFADADIDQALDAVVFMIYSLNGERCTSSSRLLIEASIHEEFIARLTQRVQKLRVGHPLDPRTEVGPLIHPRHVEKVLSYADVARSEGAQIAVGGGVCEQVDNVPESAIGQYLQPTLYLTADAQSRLAQEEIFGPVLTALPFQDEPAAIEMANSVRYGLAGYLWTRDLGRANRVALALDAGMIWVNSENVRHLPTPFGGMKASGIGRDGGDYSFDFYMQTKNVALALGTHKTPQMGLGQT